MMVALNVEHLFNYLYRLSFLSFYMIDSILSHKRNDDICYASAPVHTMETRQRIRDLRKDKVLYKSGVE